MHSTPTLSRWSVHHSMALSWSGTLNLPFALTASLDTRDQSMIFVFHLMDKSLHLPQQTRQLDYGQTQSRVTRRSLRATQLRLRASHSLVMAPYCCLDLMTRHSKSSKSATESSSSQLMLMQTGFAQLSSLLTQG